MSAPDLSALVCARLCHDLISPMGAIGNGLELMQMMPGASTGPEVALVHDSLANALAKLRFYRLAFGPADAQARLSVEEGAGITDAMFRGRITIAWEVQGADIARPDARLIFLAILCLEKSLPMGGLVRIVVTKEGLGLRVEGRRTVPPPELWAHITDGAPVPDLRPDIVQFALLHQALAATGRRLQARFSETDAALTMTADSPILV